MDSPGSRIFLKNIHFVWYLHTECSIPSIEARSARGVWAQVEIRPMSFTVKGLAQMGITNERFDPLGISASSAQEPDRKMLLIGTPYCGHTKQNCDHWHQWSYQNEHSILEDGLLIYLGMHSKTMEANCSRKSHCNVSVRTQHKLTWNGSLHLAVGCNRWPIHRMAMKPLITGHMVTFYPVAASCQKTNKICWNNQQYNKTTTNMFIKGGPPNILSVMRA